MRLILNTFQDIPDINYGKKELATPFLVNDILEEPQSQVRTGLWLVKTDHVTLILTCDWLQAYSSSGPGLTHRSMNCATPPSPPSPNLLYSGYPRSACSLIYIIVYTYQPTIQSTIFSPWCHPLISVRSLTDISMMSPWHYNNVLSLVVLYLMYLSMMSSDDANTSSKHMVTNHHHSIKLI